MRGAQPDGRGAARKFKGEMARKIGHMPSPAMRRAGPVIQGHQAGLRMSPLSVAHSWNPGCARF